MQTATAISEALEEGTALPSIVVPPPRPAVSPADKASEQGRTADQFGDPARADAGILGTQPRR